MASLWHPTFDFPAPGLTGAIAIASPATKKRKERIDKEPTKSGGEIEKECTRQVIHERVQHGRVEARVELAPEYRGRDVEAGAHFALGEAVDKLRDVVREMPCGGARELLGCDQAGLDEQRGDQRGDERRRRTEARLGHVCERDARGVKRR